MIPFRTTAPNPGSPVITMSLIVANIAVYFFQIGLVGDQLTTFMYTYALVPAVYTHPKLALESGLDPHNYWPILTNTFMHAGAIHLIFNMWTLWLFAGPLESRLGAYRFLVFYLLAGAAGSIAHLAFNLDSMIPALGASGAIAGVLGGYTLLFPKARVAIVQPIFFLPLVFHLPALIYTVIWFGLQILQGGAEFLTSSGEESGGVAWWAHIGGFVAGLILIKVMERTIPGTPDGQFTPRREHRPRSKGPWNR